MLALRFAQIARLVVTILPGGLLSFPADHVRLFNKGHRPVGVRWLTSDFSRLKRFQDGKLARDFISQFLSVAGGRSQKSLRERGAIKVLVHALAQATTRQSGSN